MSVTTTDSYAELRAKQQQVWSSGDYNKIAALTVPVNEAVVTAAGIAPGENVLDIATGTGHSALAAARGGAHVTGIDYVPALLEIARDRAAAERSRRPSSSARLRTCRSRTAPSTSWSRRSA